MTQQSFAKADNGGVKRVAPWAGRAVAHRDGQQEAQ